MNLRKDINAGASAKALVVLVVVLGAVLLYTSGMLEFTIPGLAGDEYEEVVPRTALHIGMIIPIRVTLDFDQNPRTGGNQADITCYSYHRQYKEDDNYCPNPTLISKTSYNVQVGTIDDKSTIYAVNGNGFQAQNTTVDIPIKSIDGVSFGVAQDYYKVWNTNPATMHEPNLGEGNHAILIDIDIRHYVRNTETELDSANIKVNIYYPLPAYNDNSRFEESHSFNIYVPFTRYALAEDIRVQVRAYEEVGKSVWKEVTTTRYSEWRWEIYFSLWPPGIGFKFVREESTTIETKVKYEWQRPKALPFGRDRLGSHEYLYKIR